MIDSLHGSVEPVKMVFNQKLTHNVAIIESKSRILLGATRGTAQKRSRTDLSEVLFKSLFNKMVVTSRELLNKRLILASTALRIDAYELRKMNINLGFL